MKVYQLQCVCWAVLQGEDEALAQAIAASFVEGPTTATPSLHPSPPAHHHLSQTQGSSTSATAM